MHNKGNSAFGEMIERNTYVRTMHLTPYLRYKIELLIHVLC
jgi:hypothetical protein